MTDAESQVGQYQASCEVFGEKVTLGFTWDGKDSTEFISKWNELGRALSCKQTAKAADDYMKEHGLLAR